MRQTAPRGIASGGGGAEWRDIRSPIGDRCARELRYVPRGIHCECIDSLTVYLSTDSADPLINYRNQFESEYIDETHDFYAQRASTVLLERGVQAYMQYADSKLREEENRARRYLDTNKGDSVPKVSAFENRFSNDMRVTVVGQSMCGRIGGGVQGSNTGGVRQSH